MDICWYLVSEWKDRNKVLCADPSAASVASGKAPGQHFHSVARQAPCLNKDGNVWANPKWTRRCRDPRLQTGKTNEKQRLQPKGEETLEEFPRRLQEWPHRSSVTEELLSARNFARWLRHVFPNLHRHLVSQVLESPLHRRGDRGSERTGPCLPTNPSHSTPCLPSESWITVLERKTALFLSGSEAQYKEQWVEMTGRQISGR